MASDADNVEKHSEHTIMDTDENVAKHNDINTNSKTVELEKVLAEKDDNIDTLKEIQANLKDEICNLIAKIDQLNRVAVNMQKELKNLNHKSPRYRK